MLTFEDQNCDTCLYGHKTELDDIICVKENSFYQSDYVTPEWSCDYWEGAQAWTT